MRYALALLTVLCRPAFGQTCVASATGESFGSFNPLSAVATTSTATLSVSCTATASILVSYTVALSGGGGSVAARSMSSGSGTLAYQLYRDPTQTQIWGDGTGGSVTVTDGYLLGVAAPVLRNYTAYGVIPPQSRVVPGVYNDTILVVMSY